MMRARASALYITLAFVATAVMIVALLVLQWLSFGNVEQTATLVQRTLQSERELTIFGDRVRDAETGQRGFLLTGMSAYLVPYRNAVDKVPDDITRMKVLLADNPRQLRRVDMLDTLAEEKLGELDSTVKLAEEGHRGSALSVVRTNVGDSLMRSIRIVLGETVLTEDSLLTDGEARLQDALVRRNAVSTFLSVALVLLLTVIVGVLHRLRKYEDLVTLCAWSKAVNYEGEWLSFEEYLHRRFGLSTTHGISPEALAALEPKLGDTK